MIPTMYFLSLPYADTVGFTSKLLFGLLFAIPVESKADGTRFWTGPSFILHFMRTLSSLVVVTFCIKLVEFQITNLCGIASQAACYLICKVMYKIPICLVVASVAFTAALSDTPAGTDSEHLY